MSLAHYIAITVSAAFATLVLTPLARRLGERFGWVSLPGGRNVHKGEISRVGGAAMFLGFAAALAAEFAVEHFLGRGNRALLTAGRPLLSIGAGLVVIFVVGLVDDVFSLSPGAKLVGQVAAASIVIAGGVRVDFIGNPFGGGLVYLGMLSIPVTLLWIVGFANVINLIDGLDGLAAGVTAIAALSLLVLAAQGNQLVAAALAAALIGSCLGFLRFNFAPASVFMGDSGALFLGFALATISLLGVMKSVAAIALAVPLLVIGVPIFDTASAIIRRVKHGRPIHEADKGHIHHRLLGRGFDQRQTVLIIYAWSLLLSISAYAVRYSPVLVKLGVFAVLAVLSGLMAYWLGLFEAAHVHYDEETHHHRPSIEEERSEATGEAGESVPS